MEDQSLLDMNYLIGLLNQEGYAEAELLGDECIGFKSDGLAVLLFQYSDGDLQLYFCIRIDGVWGHDSMNTWNSTHRMSRAYLDKDKHPVLENDMSGGASATSESIINFVNVFTQVSIPSFVRFLREGDYSNETLN